jgi:hypothetical protein
LKPENAQVSAYDPEPDRVDWLDLGPEPDDGGKPANPRRRYLWYGAAAGLVVLALVMTRTQHGTNRAATSTGSPSRTSTSSSPSLPSSPAGTVSSTPTPSGSFVDPAPATASADGQPAGLTGGPQVTNVGHRLLAVPADWELFAQGPGVVIRIQLALGRITTTAVPVSTSDAPVTFLVGSDRVFVRSLDGTTGYVIRDGKRPADLPHSLMSGSQMFASPDQQHLWTSPTTGDTSGLALVNLDGKPTGVTINVPPEGAVQGSDGAGYVLLTALGGLGLYEARPGSVHRITTGQLLASGPTRWLAIECDDSLSCADVVIDRATGARHRLEVPVSFGDSNASTISPDGKTAALVVPSEGINSNGIELLDLGSGTQRTLDVILRSPEGQPIPRFVWSPDSRWLFTIDAGGRVVMVNRTTGRATPLGAHLVPVTQLGLRHRAG